MSRPAILLFFLSMALATLSLAADASSPAQEAVSLSVGVILEDNYPLVYFDAAARPQGFEVAMIEHLAKAGGFASFELKTFPDKVALHTALTHHQIDLGFSKMKKNEVDGQRFIYSQAYLSLEYVFLVNRVQTAQNDLQIEPLTKLAQGRLTVGTVDDPVYSDQLRRSYPEMRIKLFKSKKAVFDAVLAGEIAACFMDELEAKHFFIVSPAAALHLQYLRGQTATDTVALIFPWDRLFFREWVNMFLTKEDYTNTKLSMILERYAEK